MNDINDDEPDRDEPLLTRKDIIILLALWLVGVIILALVAFGG